jgi:phage terminase large subunit-like protein
VIEPGERIWVGVDVGGRRALSSVVGVTDDLRVGVKSWRGEESVLFAQAEVERLAQEFVVVERAFDPWHFGPAALDLGQRGITMVEYPQRNERMAPASARLHAAVSEGRLRHPGDEHLDKAAATAVAKLLPRGWRIDRADKGGRGEIDPLIALGKVRSCDAVSWLLSGTDARNVDAQACGSKSIIAITTPATTPPRT